MTGGALAGVEVGGDSVAAAPALPAPCLDCGSISDTRLQRGPVESSGQGSKRVGGVRSRARVVNRARVFPWGEVEIRSVVTDCVSKPPVPPAGSERWSRGVSRRGRRAIRRAVAGHAVRYQQRAYLYTLTSEDGCISDEAFADAMRRWLMWLRKYVPAAARHYVWVRDLQARGVLHGHVILFSRIPRDVWLRLRALWAVKYGMGAGSVDVRAVRSSRAAAYVSKYISQHRDDEGVRVGRNGDPYVTEVFRGNAYGMSSAMRELSWHVTELVLPWGRGPELGAVNLRGCVVFFGSVDQAHDALGAALGGGDTAVPERERIRVAAHGFVDRRGRNAAVA